MGEWLSLRGSSVRLRTSHSIQSYFLYCCWYGLFLKGIGKSRIYSPCSVIPAVHTNSPYFCDGREYVLTVMSTFLRMRTSV